MAYEVDIISQMQEFTKFYLSQIVFVLVLIFLSFSKKKFKFRPKGIISGSYNFKTLCLKDFKC